MKTKYCYSVGGNSVFIVKAFNEIEKEINPVLRSIDWEESADDFQKVKSIVLNSSPRMDVFSGEMFIVGIFIMSALANELIGTIYEETIKQPFLKVVRTILNQLQKNKNRSIVHEILFRDENVDMSILVQLVVENDNEIAIHFDSIGKALSHAQEWVKSNGKKANIHCYRIKEGRYSLVPELFNSLEEVRQRQMHGR